MTELKYKEMYETLKAHLVLKHGQAFLNLSKHHQCAMISMTYLEYMKAQRERQV